MNNRNVSAFRDAVISITRQSNEQEIELQNLGVFISTRGNFRCANGKHETRRRTASPRRLITWQKCAFQANLHFKLLLISHWWDKNLLLKRHFFFSFLHLPSVLNQQKNQEEDDDRKRIDDRSQYITIDGLAYFSCLIWFVFTAMPFNNKKK